MHPSTASLPTITAKAILFSVALQLAVSEPVAQLPTNSRDTTGAFRFQTAVRLVTVTAWVTDKKGNRADGLGRGDFQVFENGEPQEIVDLSVDENALFSLVILLDTSGSMVDKLDESGDAIKHFANAMNAQSEFALYEFNDLARLVVDFTSDRRLIGRSLEQMEADGGTAMYDAVGQGLVKLREGRFERKAILLITDGNDTASQTTFETIRRALQTADVLFYVIGIGHGARGSFGHGMVVAQDEVNADVLSALAGDVGGLAVIVKGAHQIKGRDRIDDAALQVASELRHQYVLTYVASADVTAGEWRAIMVKVRNQDLRVRARRGYRPSARQ